MKTTVSPVTLGLIIRDARESHRLTQQELADKAQVSRRWLSNVENGKSGVELHKVIQLLDALDLTLYVDYSSRKALQ